MSALKAALTAGQARLAARIQAVGLLGPGLIGWPASAALLRGDEPYESTPTPLPLPAALPPVERRRAGRVVRLALAVAEQAVQAGGADARELPSVFCSSGGDGDNCHEICQTLAGPDRLLSPTRFQNSVHNTAAGYWSIAYGCTRASTALCAYDASFGAGLLEALSQLAAPEAGQLLLVAYDLDYPAPLRAARPIPDALGIALLLASADGRAPGAGLERSAGSEPGAGSQLGAESQLDAESRAGSQPRTGSGPGVTVQVGLTGAPATRMTDPSLEALRCAIPAARGLPLLERLAVGTSGTVVLDYLEGTQLAIEVCP